MGSIPQETIDLIRKTVYDAGGVLDGVQTSIVEGWERVEFFDGQGRHQEMNVRLSCLDLYALGDFVRICSLKQQEKQMTLREKLHAVYSTIDKIEKRGRNKAQSYDYIKSADVTNAIRNQLITQRVYAEINFDFVGLPYTIARAKEKDAPFAAVNVRCSVVFHDLESPDVLTGSGLGSGADLGDKAAYKAQTGALKYALKNAFLVPDEADPEADESVGGDGEESRKIDEMPDFHEAQTGARPPQDRPTQASTPRSEPEAATVRTGPSQPALSTVTPPSSGAVAADAPSMKQENAPAAVADTLPTEAEMDAYRKKFTKLGDDLSLEGKLKSSRSLPINRKLVVFMLSLTKMEAPAKQSAKQWERFFAYVDEVKAAKGMVALGELVNRTNGIEPKK